jgi:thiol-disulfide isomerase/thioredoxin
MNLEYVPEYINKFNDLCTNEEFKEKVAADFAKWEPLTKGKPAFDFTYESIDGKMVSLSDFKGKYVYIDVWATWCGPCQKEIPLLKELEKEFHGKNIVFMSVSIDKPKDKEKWSTTVKEKELEGIQLIADNEWQSSVAVDYMISGIPRFMLIDIDGNILDSRAPRPSGNIKDIILGLEGI